MQKNKRVKIVYHEPHQITGNTLELNFGLLSNRDVLPDADNSEDHAKLVTARVGVEQHFDAAAVLGEERKLEVRSSLAMLQRAV